MSRHTGADARALDLAAASDARAVQTVTLSDAALARVAGPDMQAADGAMALQDASSAFGLDLSGLNGDTVLRCGCPGCLKAAGVTAEKAAPGDGLGIPPIGGDDVPDDESSDVTLNVLEGQTIESALEYATDKDFFQFQGSAGETYEFIVDPEDTAAADMLLQIYDADGNPVGDPVDGGGGGSDEELDFTPTKDGTYYVAVAGYNDAAIGGYSITGKLDDDAPDPNKDTPLDAIDWGTRVDTDGVKNADGDEVIHVYFAKAGEVTPHPLTEENVNQGWSDYAKAAAFVSFELYENVIDVDFVEVDSQAEADFIFGASPSAPVLLGAMSPPGEPTEGAAWFNTTGVGWDEKGLAQGGFGFITFTHELGHGMGMAHPHDNGGNSTVMNGVDSDTDSGDYHLNQGVHTVMTYNDGWPDGPDGKSPSDNYGFEGTMMAFDIAVLQQKYAANMEFHKDGDVYVLPDANREGDAATGEAATMYACIWDTGGTDTISAGDAKNVTIDLREATLKYEVGGGGWVSHGYQEDGSAIYGGFTIANGVKIENAIGSDTDDILVGNQYANRLTGGEGDDVISGGARKDVLRGEAGADELSGDAGKDRLIAGEGQDLLTGGGGADRFIFREALEMDRITDLRDGDIVRLSRIDANINKAGNQEFTLVDHFTDTAGQATIKYNATQDVTRLSMDTDGDGRADMVLLMDGDQTAFDGFTGFVS
ncbi:MAG TPA: M10 family metallopeptidase C-terminal domain-containing protein [Caulobacteraceae bacterium]|jgi:serralysin